MADFTLPELGENIAAGDVLRVLVQPGDTLAKDQPVLELETDKATIEVPSTLVGKITAVKVKAGDKVKVGQAILSVEDGATAAAPPTASKPAPVEQAAPPPSPAAPVAPAESPRPVERSEDAPTERVRGTGTPGLDKVVDFARGARAPVESRPADEPAAPA